MRKNKYLYHEPVMLSETLSLLNVGKLAHLQGPQVVDATLGFAGHTIEILKKGIDVIGFEADPQTAKLAIELIDIARPASKHFGSFKLINSNFRNLQKRLSEEGVGKVNAFLFDLGVSSFQLTSTERGFSFLHPRSSLDMRLDSSTQVVTAAMLLNALNKQQLNDMFSKVLDYKSAKLLSENIIRVRTTKPFVTVMDLLDVVGKLSRERSSKINPATKIFMALRMAVNGEIENLTEALPQAFDLLKSKGRLAVITFHSGEDVIVKDYFNSLYEANLVTKITKKPVTPSEKEINRNPKSRSAKLRVIEKV